MRLLKFFKRSINPFYAVDDEDYVAGLSNTYAGVRVTPETAVRLSAVYGCVRVISETLAAIPLLVHKKEGEKQSVDLEDPLYTLLYYRPNPWMSSYDFFRLQMSFVLLQGNAYSHIIRKRGKPTMLVPLHPQRVKVRLTAGGQKIYSFMKEDSSTLEIPMDSMLHFKGMSNNGLTGLSVIEDVAKQSIGLGLAQEEYGSRSFGQRANIAGTLEHPTKLDDSAHKRISDSWNKTYSGLQASHKVAILEGGMKFNPISMTNEAAQYIEARKFQVEEICRIFRVPPHKIMDFSRAHFNNIEHTSIEFYTETIVPWATCIEKEIDWILIGEPELKRRFVKFNMKAVLRGDNKTRAEVQNTRLNNGMLSINEAREEEDLNPIGPEGDVHRIPLNTGAATEGDTVEPDDKPELEEEPKKEEPKVQQPEPSSRTKDMERLKYAFIRTLEDSISRVCRREAAEIRSESKKIRLFSEDSWPKNSENWAKMYEKLVTESVRGAVFAWVESLIFYEKAEKTRSIRPRNLENSGILSDKLAYKWGISYGQQSRKLLTEALSLEKRDLSELAEDIERTRARREAEKWIEEIETEVGIALYGTVHETNSVEVKVHVEHEKLPPPTTQILQFSTDSEGRKVAKVIREPIQ